jgi:type II secretory pathway component GspD/PulD (secretin)
MQTKRTELLIILTPRIIRSSEDSELIRQTELARMNWCAADVFELQGDIGFTADRQLDEVEQGQPEVIIPDENPSGEPLPRP